MRAARIRLAFLWVSQVARVLADWCLRFLAFLSAAGEARADSGSAWHLATAVFIAPFLLLAPVNGCLNNGLPRRWVLIGSSAFTLLAVLACALLSGSWLVCLGVVALGAAVYSPSRYAVLPAASLDCRVPLPRLNGWVEMGGAAAIVGGVALGWYVAGADWPGTTMPVDARAVWLLIGLNLLCLVTALPVWFASDTRRPEPALEAVGDFFRDCRRILIQPAARGHLLGLSSFQALVTAAAGALVAETMDLGAASAAGMLQALLLIGLGTALGCATASWQGHPRRSLGLIPKGTTGLLLALGWAALAVEPGAPLPRIPCVLLGFLGGLVNVPLRAAYMAAVPADARGNGMAVMNALIYLCTTLMTLLMYGLTSAHWLATPAAQLAFLLVPATVGAVIAWRILYPQAIEEVWEWMLAPMYRIHLRGPGKVHIPPQGPFLVVANHASYFDPFWVCKSFPRPLRPMMTSVFFDLPIVHWCMVNVTRAIRVPDAGFRREAPELAEAITALRNGECVLIFPEGRLRRKEDQLLRQFGQGVWHILHELPQTPVFVCWLEGGWKSFCSYWNGPPMKNKRIDFRRRVDIAVAEPLVLPAELLADQRATRAFLMRACLECRRILGLDVPATPTAPDEAEQKCDVTRPADSDAHQINP
jgi:1-acyl-sn-glycerol-3-phosphate acyltransferase